MAEPEVVIYYGPPSWFRDQIGDPKGKNFLTLVNKLDEFRRRMRVTVDGQPGDPSENRRHRPKQVIVESSDFVSLQEHVINNFANFVQDLRPKQIFVNNPPTRVHEQLTRAFGSTRIENFAYPTVSQDVLRNFHRDFAAHLVGQQSVRELLLASMYPLAQAGRETPVVVMLYGPSGVGKTESAHFVNSLLGGELMRKQFSMFHSEKFTSYLFGGSHTEGSLAHDLLDRESGVILIDEFDKANSIFHSAFYEIFDTGRFVDKNYSVNVGPALIMCTSNYHTEDDIRESLGDALTSRFDALIEFEPLSIPETAVVIKRVFDSHLKKLRPEERDAIDSEHIFAQLLQLSDKVGNVRQVKKIIEMTISLALVQSMIGLGGDATSTELD